METNTTFDINKFVEYNKKTDKSICLIETCQQQLSGRKPYNIKRHYMSLHGLDCQEIAAINSIDESQTSIKMETTMSDTASETQASKSVTRSTSNARTEPQSAEIAEIIFNNAKFDITKFVKYDKHSNKSTCLVKACRRKLTGKKSYDVRQHYKSMHKKDCKEYAPSSPKNESPPPKIDINEYVQYNKDTNKSTCLVASCRRELSGKSPYDIRRHYRRMHPIEREDGASNTSNNMEKTMDDENLESQTSNNTSFTMASRLSGLRPRNIQQNSIREHEIAHQDVAPSISENESQILCSSNKVSTTTTAQKKREFLRRCIDLAKDGFSLGLFNECSNCQTLLRPLTDLSSAVLTIMTEDDENQRM